MAYSGVPIFGPMSCLILLMKCFAKRFIGQGRYMRDDVVFTQWSTCNGHLNDENKEFFPYCVIVLQCAQALPSGQIIVTIIPHNNDIIMRVIASQITSLTIVYATVYSGVDRRRHQRSVSLAFVRGINRWAGNSSHKGPVMRQIFHFITSSCVRTGRMSKQ